VSTIDGTSFIVTRAHVDGTIEFRGSIDGDTLQSLLATLSPFDRRLIQNCGNSSEPSDMMLAIELIFRRLKEQGK
jgi:hypothetical protein